jgi:hypothetical protein
MRRGTVKMVRSLVSKVMWVGRATVFLVGLAVILALLFGAATTALAHSNVDNKLFHLGHSNSATTPTSLVSTLADAAKSALIVQNKSGGPALDLKVTDLDTTNPALKDVAPMKVDSQAKVTNLNADELDGLDSSQLAAANTVKVGHLRLTQPATDGQINSGTIFETNAFRIDGYCLNTFVSASTPEAGFRVVAKQNDTAIIYTPEGSSTPVERYGLVAGQFVDISQTAAAADSSIDGLKTYGTYVADAPGGSNTPPSLLEGHGTASVAGVDCRFSATGLGK